MNKKGFTLVELLAVIAILAILVIIAMPNVLKRFNAAKKNTFETEVKELISEAETKYIEDSMFSTSTQTYDSETNPLNMSGEELDYSIYMDNTGNITCLQVNNGSYQFEYSGTGITKSDTITSTDKEDDFTPNCEKKLTDMFTEDKVCFINLSYFFIESGKHLSEEELVQRGIIENGKININKILTEDDVMLLDIDDVSDYYSVNRENILLYDFIKYYMLKYSDYPYLTQYKEKYDNWKDGEVDENSRGLIILSTKRWTESYSFYERDENYFINSEIVFAAEKGESTKEKILDSTKGCYEYEPN